MCRGALKSNAGRGRQGAISVMTSLWFHHGPELKIHIFFKRENTIQTLQ